MHTNAEVDDQQHGFKVSYTSESCDTLSTSVHDWLERGVWTEPPTDLRLNDGRWWQVVNALLLSSPGVSVRWSSGSTHLTTDPKHVENLAGLSVVKSPTSELSTAAESVMSRRSTGVVSCLGSSEPADCQSYEAENCTDVTVPVRKVYMQVVNACKAQEDIYMDQVAVPATMNKPGLQIDAEELSQGIQTPITVLVWIDGAWSGDSVSYKQLFAGAGRLKNHVTDARE